MDILAYLALPLSIILGIKLIKLKAHKIVPWFSIYILFEIVEGFARFFVRHHYNVYFFVYWYTDIALMLIELGVLIEIYRYVFRDLARMWWLPIVVAITLILLGIRILNSPPPVAPIVARMLIAEMGLRLLQGVILMVLAFSTPFFHLRWKRYPLGIITGFGFYAVVSLIATSKFSVFVTKPEIFRWIDIVAYIITLLIWIWFFRKPQEPDPRVLDASIYDGLAEMQKYRRILKRFRER